MIVGFLVFSKHKVMAPNIFEWWSVLVLLWSGLTSEKKVILRCCKWWKVQQILKRASRRQAHCFPCFTPAETLSYFMELVLSAYKYFPHISYLKTLILNKKLLALWGLHEVELPRTHMLGQIRETKWQWVWSIQNCSLVDKQQDQQGSKMQTGSLDTWEEIPAPCTWFCIFLWWPDKDSYTAWSVKARFCLIPTDII